MAPPAQGAAFSTGLPAASETAAVAASRPSSRESFQMVAVCVPSATRFSAAKSASWPDTGMPRRPLAVSAATAPPAVPSLAATTASTLLPFLVRICSMFFCATSGFQPSVYSSPTILMSPFLIAASSTSCWPARRKSAFGSLGEPLMIT
ncbi:hypothetical protein D3C72_1429690 [compost metagenome]